MNRFFSAELEISDVQASFLPEDDLSASESDSDAVDSDVEFHLYSQLHYSSSYFEGDSQECNIVTPLESNDVTNSESDDNYVETDGNESTSKKEDDIAETVGPFKREDIAHLKEFLEQDNEDFVPESWEIIDSVDEEDDEMVDIHIHDSAGTVSSSEDEESEEEEMSPSKDCWKIDERDRNRFKPESKGRYYSNTPNSRQRCKNCNEMGHIARECPEAKKQPVCFICGNRGHLGKECLERQNLHSFRRNVECNRCGQIGHIQRECPDIWRQFHATTKIGRIVIPETPVEGNKIIQCYNCGSNRHFGEECEGKQNCYYPLQTVFVCVYDESAGSRAPRPTSSKSKPKHGKQHDTKEKPAGNKPKRKSDTKQKRQHIIFDSSSSTDPVEHHKKHRAKNEHSDSQSKAQNKKQNDTRTRNIDHPRQEKHKAQNESKFNHEGSRKRRYDYSGIDHPQQNAKKRTKVPEIVYHNTRKVVIDDSSPLKKGFSEFKEPFPRSKKPHNRQTEKHDKKRRHDDRSRKITQRGFQERLKK